MHWSTPNFNIPAGNPPGIWTFDDWLIQIPPPPPPWAKIAFKYPTLVPDLMENVSPVDV